MFTPMIHVMKLNNTLQSVHNASYENAAKNRWAAEVANEIEGAGVADIRAFLIEDLKVRVGTGVEMSDLRTHAMTVAHQQAGGGFAVRDRDFKAQQAMQILTDASAGLGASSSLLGQQMLLDLINSTTAKAYDALPFWSTGHYVNYKDNGQGVYGNTLVRDLNPQNLAEAVAIIESRTLADGKTPRMLKARWLLHPPTLKKAAYEATSAQFISATSNVLAMKSTYDVTPVQVPGLAQVGGKDQWIVAGELEGGGTFARPFGISTLIPMTITNYDGMSIPMLKMMQELKYVASGDLTAYLGHPFLVQRGILT